MKIYHYTKMSTQFEMSSCEPLKVGNVLKHRSNQNQLSHKHFLLPIRNDPSMYTTPNKCYARSNHVEMKKQNTVFKRLFRTVKVRGFYDEPLTLPSKQNDHSSNKRGSNELGKHAEKKKKSPSRLCANVCRQTTAAAA